MSHKSQHKIVSARPCVWICWCPWAGAQQSSDSICLPCPTGAFASIYGSTVCLACPLGFYSSLVASKNCSSCWSEATRPCNPISSNGCVEHCSSLQFHVNPTGGYLCRYSADLNTPEFKCTIPDFVFKQKISCEFEASLLCKVQQPQGGNVLKLEINLECQTMRAWSEVAQQNNLWKLEPS